jgi:hypothetical protein
MALAPHLFLVV